MEGELVGGCYGIALGSIFFGESMFARRSDASKIAFVHLVEYHVLNKIIPNKHYQFDNQLVLNELINTLSFFFFYYYLNKQMSTM